MSWRKLGLLGDTTISGLSWNQRLLFFLLCTSHSCVTSPADGNDLTSWPAIYWHYTSHFTGMKMFYTKKELKQAVVVRRDVKYRIKGFKSYSFVGRWREDPPCWRRASRWFAVCMCHGNPECQCRRAEEKKERCHPCKKGKEMSLCEGETTGIAARTSGTCSLHQPELNLDIFLHKHLRGNIFPPVVTK